MNDVSVLLRRQKLCTLIAAAGTACGASSSYGQVLTEHVLGTVSIAGPQAGAPIIARRGDQFARRERVEQGERYVSLAGPGQTFTRILPGAVWVGDRLVYFALQGQQKVLVDGKKVIKLKGTGTSPSLESRPYVSMDGSHYAAFDSTGTTVRWYLDGKVQSSTFDRLVLATVVAPHATPMFVANRNCLASIVGSAPSSGYRWDLVNWVQSSSDGKYVYAYGQRANLARLELNGKKLYDGLLDQFAVSETGTTWMAVSEKTEDDLVRTDVVKDGKVVATANVDRSRVGMTMTSDGTTWTLRVSDEDYSGMTLSRPGRSERRFDQAPLEYHLSRDGAAEAMVFRSATDPSKLDVFVDEKQVYAGARAIRSNHIPLLADGRFAVTVIEAEKRFVVSHLGTGPSYNEISDVMLLPDGRPAYVGRGPDGINVHVGSWSAKFPANDVHYVATLRLEQGRLRVLGTRGEEVVDFTVTVN